MAAEKKKPKPKTKTPSPASTPATTEQKLTQEVSLRSVGEWHKTARWAIVALAVVILGYFGFRSVEVSAGKETDFRAILRAAVDLSVSETIGAAFLALCGGTVIYNYRGRKKAESGASRAATLEKMVDPGRTGSDLLSDGRNPEGDPE